MAWLRALAPKPWRIFTGTTFGGVSWRATRAKRTEVPERNLALVGADNDVLECELTSPPLST